MKDKLQSIEEENSIQKKILTCGFYFDMFGCSPYKIYITFLCYYYLKFIRQDPIPFSKHLLYIRLMSYLVSKVYLFLQSIT